MLTFDDSQERGRQEFPHEWISVNQAAAELLLEVGHSPENKELISNTVLKVMRRLRSDGALVSGDKHLPSEA